MDVSVIIVNYNTLGLTSDCIESIIAQTSTVEYEIILVDNASTDGSKEVFAQDKRIKYIYSDRNLGFGRANNLGIREAKGRYLFFLNSDTILLNNAVKLFFDFCEKNPDRKIGAVGAVLKDQNQKNIHSPSLLKSVIKRTDNNAKLQRIKCVTGMPNNKSTFSYFRVAHCTGKQTK